MVYFPIAHCGSVVRRIHTIPVTDIYGWREAVCKPAEQGFQSIQVPQIQEGEIIRLVLRCGRQKWVFLHMRFIYLINLVLFQ